MLSFSRIRGQLGTFAGFAIVLLLWLFIISIVLRGRPHWLTDRVPGAPIGSVKEAAARIVAVSNSMRAPSPRPFLGVLVGASDLRCDVDPTALDTGPKHHWAAMYTMGSNTNDLRFVLDMITQYGLNENAVVLMLVPSNFTKDAFIPADDPDPKLGLLVEHLSKRQYSALKHDLSVAVRGLNNQLFPYRSSVKQRVRLELFKFKLTILAAIGLKLNAAVAADPAPWTTDFEWGQELRASAYYVKEQTEGYLDKRVFDSANYGSDSPQLRLIVDTLRDLRRQNLEPIIVLSPLRSDFRERVPKEAAASFYSTLQSNFDVAPKVIDARETMPDDLFHDLTHLNYQGKARFTAILSERLSSVLNSADTHPENFEE